MVSTPQPHLLFQTKFQRRSMEDALTMHRCQFDVAEFEMVAKLTAGFGRKLFRQSYISHTYRFLRHGRVLQARLVNRDNVLIALRNDFLLRQDSDRTTKPIIELRRGEPALPFPR
jgi:hypothetical protein